MKETVGRLRLGSLVWLGMILVGSCLGAFVFAAWPEPSTYMSRLPHGESRPKTPSVAVVRQATVERVVASVDVVTLPQAEAAADMQPVERELAGPPPVPADSESDGYRAETPEELGAKPLPGMNPSVPTPLGEPAPAATTS